MNRRAVLIGAAATGLAGMANAQTQAFIGTWHEKAAGLGDINLVITGVKADGEVEGKMEFPGQGRSTAFASKPEGSNVARGTIKGSEMTIEFSSGARYDLKLERQMLVGHYTRGNSVKLGFNFRKR